MGSQVFLVAGNSNVLWPGHHYQKFQQQEAKAAHFDFSMAFLDSLATTFLYLGYFGRDFTTVLLILFLVFLLCNNMIPSLNISRVKIFAVEPDFLISGLNLCGLKAFLKLSVYLDKCFKVKIFTVQDKTSKSVKILHLNV